MIRKHESRAGRLQDREAPRGAIDTDRFVTEVLTFFASNPDETMRFLQASGLHAADLRTTAADPGFALGLLDYFMQGERALERLCDATAMDAGSIYWLHERLRVHGLTSHDDV